MTKRVEYDFDPGITFPSYLIRNRLIKGIQKLAPQLHGDLLDFGCGSKPYESLFSVNKYTGLDYESPGHPHINERIDFFYDGKKIPFDDESFDCIFSSEVFEHVFNLEEIIPELNRVLKKGGMMLITCPFAIGEHEIPNDYARYTSYGLRDLLQRNGFDVLEYLKTGNAVETVFQLWIMYIHQHITPFVRKIPVLRSAFRFFTYTSLNLMAVLFSKILPKRKDLYLNNVILCRKKGDQ